ncbi:MAG: hypothetical protein L0I29_08900 [Hyphomicrobiales bacterium]|nr:hypothetical protein [Hyphomicrobiales bacterium]
MSIRRIGVSSTDFRQLLTASEKDRAERLFRAAVTAFCSLVRPSRRDIDQLDELALALFDMVPADARRFVAAALSESPHAPQALTLRLANEPVDIAAPLLIRSTALSDFDLATLISRHGAAHARVIARRPSLSASIRRFAENSLVARKKMPETPPTAETRKPAAVGEKQATAEETRRKLQAMMRPAGSQARFENRSGKVFDESAGISHYEKLCSTALTGVPVFFQTALADALDVEFERARALTETGSYYYLLVALKALGLDEGQAFLLTAAAFPSHFAHPETIRLFLERYRQLHRDAAIEKVGYWKVDSFSVVSARTARERIGDNADTALSAVATLKAS